MGTLGATRHDEAGTLRLFMQHRFPATACASQGQHGERGEDRKALLPLFPVTPGRFLGGIRVQEVKKRPNFATHIAPIGSPDASPLISNFSLFVCQQISVPAYAIAGTGGRIAQR